MTSKLNLRLRPDDWRNIDAAAAVIAGPAGASHVRRIHVIRTALAAFLEQHQRPSLETA